MTDLPVRFALLLLSAVMGAAQAQSPAPATGIRAQVYGIHYGGNIVYHYKVTNNGDTPFNNFTIGSYFNTEQDDEYPQLTRLPLGWRYGREGETGTAIILAQGSTSQPTSWNSNVFGQEETGNYYLEWRASPGRNVPNVIWPGQTLAGFSVTVPMEDSELDLPMVTGPRFLPGLTRCISRAASR